MIPGGRGDKYWRFWRAIIGIKVKVKEVQFMLDNNGGDDNDGGPLLIIVMKVKDSSKRSKVSQPDCRGENLPWGGAEIRLSTKLWPSIIVATWWGPDESIELLGRRGGRRQWGRGRFGLHTGSSSSSASSIIIWPSSWSCSSSSAATAAGISFSQMIMVRMCRTEENSGANKSPTTTKWNCKNLLLRNSASSFHWLSSSIFSYCSFVRPSRIVTPHLISTIWCFRPYKPYIFCEDMIQACQCHSFLSWAQFTVVWSFTCVSIISFWWKRQIMHTNFTMILWTCNRVDQKLHKTNFQLICHTLLSWPVGHSYM